MTALKVGSDSWWQSKHGPQWQRLNDEMYQVTFWWRDPQGSEERSAIKRVWVYITGVTDHHQNSQPQSMQRIAGTDVWQWTTQLNANWRGSYCFIPTERADIFLHHHQIASNYARDGKITPSGDSRSAESAKLERRARARCFRTRNAASAPATWLGLPANARKFSQGNYLEK